MFPISEFRDCLTRATGVLRNADIGFYITGGAAFIAYGDPRTTQDIDLVIDAERLTPILTSIIEQWEQAQFLLNETAIRDALRLKRQFQLIDMVSAMKIDLYPKEFVAGAIDRARDIEIFPNASFPVASIPDLVASKLIWIRKGSHKSRRDVRQLLTLVKDEDRQATRELAEQMSLLLLLDEVLAEPDEIDLVDE